MYSVSLQIIVCSFSQLFRRLNSELMTETTEEQLLSMKAHLIKINKYRLSTEAKLANSKVVDGKLDLTLMKNRISHHVVVLYPASKTDVAITNYKKFDRRTSDGNSVHASMNQEWRTMFAAQDNVQVLLLFISQDFYFLFFTLDWLVDVLL